jgi:hypothetical protein
VARRKLLDRLRRTRGEQPGAEQPAELGNAASAPPPPRRAAPSPGALRRERRAILRAREERIRDLGGLALEMFRQDRFREDLLAEQCQDLISLEARLHELDSMLAANASRTAKAARCECGAPIIWGSHFCANCGRPVGEKPVVSCTNCGHPLPADARFCANCGQAAELGEADERAPGRPVDNGEPGASAARSALRGPVEQPDSSERQTDPWER